MMLGGVGGRQTLSEARLVWHLQAAPMRAAQLTTRWWRFVMGSARKCHVSLSFWGRKGCDVEDGVLCVLTGSLHCGVMCGLNKCGRAPSESSRQVFRCQEQGVLMTARPGLLFVGNTCCMGITQEVLRESPL